MFHPTGLVEETDNPPQVVLGRTVPATHLTFPHPTQSTLLFIGAEQSPLLQIWLMTFVHFTEVLHYCPKERRMTRFRRVRNAHSFALCSNCQYFSPSSMRQLRRRLFLIEKLRDAKTVGLVVGTLSTEGFREAINRTRELCKTANKKLYVLSVGKVSVWAME